MPEIVRRLDCGRLSLRCGPFAIRIESPFPAVAAGLSRLYANHPIVDTYGFADFTVRIVRPRHFRRWFKPQAEFRFDRTKPFQPLPATQAFPMLEWATNWCIASHAHQFLILHAAVVARDVRALILPGPPGAGKSTLAAGLVSRGWRLLSDEFALIDTENRTLAALARPISLKNESINVIREFAGPEVLHETIRGTSKGALNHMRPPAESVERMDDKARPCWVLFPHFSGYAPVALTERSRGTTMMDLARNGFNYSLLGRRGFECLADVVGASGCYDLTYGDLADATRVLAEVD